jgi:cytochrome c
MKPIIFRSSLMAAVCAFIGLFGTAASGAEGGATEADAVAMVKKGVSYLHSQGREAGYAEFTSKTSAFHLQDLYLVVYGLDGVVRAHGANEKMVGKNLLGLKDIDGKAFVQERVDLAKAKSTFWQDYKFTNPENHKVEPKRMYCERMDDVIVCGGIYK